MRCGISRSRSCGTLPTPATFLGKEMTFLTQNGYRYLIMSVNPAEQGEEQADKHNWPRKAEMDHWARR